MFSAVAKENWRPQQPFSYGWQSTIVLLYHPSFIGIVPKLWAPGPKKQNLQNQALFLRSIFVNLPRPISPKVFGVGAYTFAWWQGRGLCIHAFKELQIGYSGAPPGGLKLRHVEKNEVFRPLLRNGGVLSNFLCAVSGHPQQHSTCKDRVKSIQKWRLQSFYKQTNKLAAFHRQRFSQIQRS